MRWFSVSKWMQCVAPSVDRNNVFHSSSGELSDAPWSPSSCDHRSTSSVSSSSSSSGASAGSGGRSFAKRLFGFPRAGRKGLTSSRGSGKKEVYHPYADGVTPEMSYMAGQEDEYLDYSEEDLSHPSLWQKHILLGEKCEPLAFSGLILYDAAGNRISKLPAKSPLHPSLTGGPD